MNRNEILETAQAAISGQRHEDYGDARENFTNIGKLWEVVLGQAVPPEEVALCLALVKVARLLKSPDHEDSWVDIAGYAALGGEVSIP